MVSTKIQKIDYAVLHNPDLIPILLKDCSISKGLIYSRMRRLVPRRVGIEFECMGNPLDYYKFVLKKNITGSEDFEKIFNLLDYSQDLPITRGSSSTDSDSSLGITRFRNLTQIITESDNELFNELRVSIKDYSQLRGLYNILKLFKNSCIIPSGGGIHIHIDFSDYDDYGTRVISKKYINNHLKEVEDIFPKYTGTYNKRKVGISHKGTYVNLSRHGSIEFRIAPLTFDYETLIEWIVKCNKFVTKLIHECHLMTDKEIENKPIKPSPNVGLNGETTDGEVDECDSDLQMTYEELREFLDRIRANRVASSTNAANSYYDSFGWSNLYDL